MVTFPVAHGAWSAGWAWKKMHPLLREQGHELITPSYTGLGERVHLARRNAWPTSCISTPSSHATGKDSATSPPSARADPSTRR